MPPKKAAANGRAKVPEPPLKGQPLIFGYLALLLGLTSMYAGIVPGTHDKLASLGDVVPMGERNLTAYPYHAWPNPQEVDLAYGSTHYYIVGKGDGVPVVIVHGITTPSWGVRDLVNKVAKTAKGPVLVYDLYGRGYSSGPGTVYNEGLYVSQLTGLLHKIQWPPAPFKQFHLLGQSLGGAIATAYASKHPENIASLVLVAPAGLIPSLPLVGKITTLPVVGDLIVHLFGSRIIKFLSKKNFFENPRHSPPVHHGMLVTDHTIDNHPGFLRAYLSTVRHFPLTSLHSRYQALHDNWATDKFYQNKKKVLAIWGDKDGVVPYTCMGLMETLVPNAQYVTIPGGGHIIAIENITIVMDSITKFWSPR